MKPSPPLLSIDFLKVFAVCLIITHHLSNYGQIAQDATLALPNTIFFLFEYGRYAVQIFLVLAGYLAAQSLSCFAVIAFSSKTLLRVVINRYLRLVVPFIAALILTMVCAWLARFWVTDEFVGETETLGQFVAHLFLIQDILGLESITAGAWYVAIDWQLYAVLAILFISFSSYQAVIWLLAIVAVASLLFFNRSGVYEAYFIYFIGSYSLGVLAYLAKNYPDLRIARLAKVSLMVIGALIALSSFQEIWLRNYLAWFVALILLIWGNTPYSAINIAKHPLRAKILKAMQWGSQRSYCAFLIHFAFILLANTIYIALGWHAYENGSIAIGLMFSALFCIIVAANYLYRWVELPAMKLKI